MYGAVPADVVGPGAVKGLVGREKAVGDGNVLVACGAEQNSLQASCWRVVEAPPSFVYHLPVQGAICGQQTVTYVAVKEDSSGV